MRRKFHFRYTRQTQCEPLRPSASHFIQTASRYIISAVAGKKNYLHYSVSEVVFYQEKSGPFSVALQGDNINLSPSLDVTVCCNVGKGVLSGLSL